MNLRRQLATLRARLPIIILTTVASGALVFLATSLQPKVYEAQTTLIVGQSLSGVNPDYTQLLASQRLSATYARIATLPAVLSSAIADLKLRDTPEELATRVRAEAPLDTTLLTIVAQDSDPARAALLANTLANRLIAASPAVQGRESEIQRSVDEDLNEIQAQMASTQAQIEKWNALPTRTPAQEAALVTLQGQIISLRSTYATLLTFASANASNAISVVQPAIPPSTPVSPRPLLNAQLAALLGLLIAVGLAFGLEYMKDAMKDGEDVQETVGLSTLASIGRARPSPAGSKPELASLAHPQSRHVEGFRTLRANIEFSSVDAPIRTLLLTSPARDEGKTVTAANLAVVFAQAGRRVLLVDANLRTPALHMQFDIPNTHGLTTLLRTNSAGLEDVAFATAQQHLTVLPSGPLPPNPTELLGSQRMQTVLEKLQSQYDLILFDSPPVLSFSDAAVLSSFLDATLVMVKAGHTRRRALRAAWETLSKAGANVLGVVVNSVPERELGDDVVEIPSEPSPEWLSRPTGSAPTT